MSHHGSSIFGPVSRDQYRLVYQIYFNIVWTSRFIGAVMDCPNMFSRKFHLNSEKRRVPYSVYFIHAAPHVWRHVVRPSVRRRRFSRDSASVLRASAVCRHLLKPPPPPHHHYHHHLYTHATPHIAAETTTPPPDRP